MLNVLDTVEPQIIMERLSSYGGKVYYQPISRHIALYRGVPYLKCPLSMFLLIQTKAVITCNNNTGTRTVWYESIESASAVQTCFRAVNKKPYLHESKAMS